MKFCQILSTHNFSVICLWCRTDQLLETVTKQQTRKTVSDFVLHFSCVSSKFGTWLNRIFYRSMFHCHSSLMLSLALTFWVGWRIDRVSVCVGVLGGGGYLVNICSQIAIHCNTLYKENTTTLWYNIQSFYKFTFFIYIRLWVKYSPFVCSL